MSTMRRRASASPAVHAMGPQCLSTVLSRLPVHTVRRDHRRGSAMIKLVLLFVTTGAALVVAVALIVGIAWIAVAVPVVIVTGTGYGLIALNRRWAEKLGEEDSTDSRRPPGEASS